MTSSHKTNAKKKHHNDATTSSVDNLTANPYQVSLSPKFAILSLLWVSLTCFALGSVARKTLLPPPPQPPQRTVLKDTQHSLPPLFVAPHKQVPHTRYTAKHFDTGLSIGSDTLLGNKKVPVITNSVEAAAQEVNDTFTMDVDEDEIHEPAGQHLLIDIEHVDGAFLNSEHHLAQAMIDLVDFSGLTMLSYHCHKLLPVGISCAGVLLESHVSFHTWPVQGVITLDLFTCGPNSLLNLLGDVQTLFARNDVAKEEEPNMIWAFKRRGFETDEGYTPGISDLGTTLLGVLQLPKKEQVSFFQTPYQSVHIYNVLDPRYSNDKNKMERRMYLDGVLQSRQRGQAAYAEAFVHPALLTHKQPRRVAIVGGGDGATLREVLKHSSIEQVQVVEIDQAVAEISQEWLWSQCDDFLAVTNCREDARVQEYYQDGLEWFQQRYGSTTNKKEELQDVIILDVLNPEDDVDFSEVLFDDLVSAKTLFGALAEDGILAVKLGVGPSLDDPPEQWTRAHHVAKLVANLEQVGFTTIHEYEDSHGGILEDETSSFLVAFKDDMSQKEWSSFANEALGQVKLQERLVRTKSGTLPLKYVDAATLQSYQMPSRTSEVMFCRNQQAKNSGERTCQEQEVTQETTGTCVNELYVSDSAATLLAERGQSVSGLQSNNFQTTEAYNPFRTRNAFANACVAKGATGQATQAVPSNSPTLEMTLTPMEEEGQEENIVAASCDSRRPNFTTARGHRNVEEISAEGECTAGTATAQALYDADSA